MKGSEKYVQWFAPQPSEETAAEIYDDDSSEDEAGDIDANAAGDGGGELLTRPVHGDTNVRPWIRSDSTPALAPTDDLLFQHIETTYFVDWKRNVPIVCLHGCDANGTSVLAWTDTFQPYFYARISDAKEAARIRASLEDMFLRTDKGAVKQRKWEFLREQEKRENAWHSEEEEDGNDKRCQFRFVLKMEPVQMRSMNGWHRNRPLETMQRFTMAHPSHVKTARDSLEYNNPSITMRPIDTFEGNVPFELRFMVDTKLGGCQWIRLPPDAYKLTRSISSSASIQVHIDHTLMQAVPLAEKGDLAAMRFLSFDIEAKRKRPGFCKGEEDPCVCICAALWVVGVGYVHSVVFLYTEQGSVGPVEGAHHVFVHNNEASMLLAFAAYVRESDPDAFTGWNISGFDWPYLVKRCIALDIYEEFLDFTRRPGKNAWLRPQKFESKAHGARKSNELVCEGRFTFDALVFMIRGQLTKYRSYKLNAISKELLEDSKVDVDYTQIPILHEGRDEDRAWLCYYCLKDAMLPLRILENRMAVVNLAEQARATGVPMKWILERGQGMKVSSCLLRKHQPWELMPSRSPKENGLFTKGGAVRKPISGHYRHPIATLDFTSLYPSIMQAFNICYTTFEWLSWARANMAPEDYWVPPTGEGEDAPDYCFVRKHIRLGVLPDLLTDLLAQRNYVKGLMKACDKVTQAVLYGVLNGRQLAIKVVNNSTYGYTKGHVWCNKRLMDGVTRWGRDMIHRTASLVQQHYRQHSIVDRAACLERGIDFERQPAPAAGEPDLRPRKLYDARIIYGDSVTADTVIPIRYSWGETAYVTAEELFFTFPTLLVEVDAHGKECVAPPHCDGAGCEIQVWSDAGWTPIECVIRHCTDKRIFRVTTADGSWVDVTSDHSLLTADGQIIRPGAIRLGQRLLQAERPATLSASSPQALRKLAANIEEDDAAVISVEDRGPCPPGAYVYDLQTSNHHFAAGVGKLVVHNTDSVMVDFGDAPIQDIARYAREAAKLCSDAMQKPNELTPESLKLRSLFFKPKMYGTLEILMSDLKPDMTFEQAVAKAKISDKGVQSVRRDNAPIGSETQFKVFELILGQDDVAGGVKLVKETIQDLLMNRVDMSRLVITQGLNKTDEHYEESGTKQRHTELKKRISARTKWTGEIVPETGDRVPYIMRAGNLKDKACDLSEDPIFAMKHGVPINIPYYIKKQILPATLSIFTCIWEPTMLPFIESNMSSKKMRQFRAYQELFAPSQPHMLAHVIPKSQGYGIASHAVVLPICAHPGCGVRLHGGERSLVVCDEHRREVTRMVLEGDTQDARDANAAAWNRCRTCAGDGFKEEHCTNTICDNFFYRRKTAAHAGDMEDLLARFDTPDKPPDGEVEIHRPRRVIDKVAEAGGEAAWRAQREANAKKSRRGRKRK